MPESRLPDALFFDVDGVLIDSLAVKGEAFADSFDDIVGSRETVVNFHLAHGGVTRTEKIAMLYRLLVGEDASKDELQMRVNRFANAVRDRVIAADDIPGARAAVQRWALRCPIHAVSATPSDELIVILTARGIAGHFRGIHGWPPAKGETIATLVEQHAYAAERCVLIGDSAQDLRASRDSGIQFIHLRAAGAGILSGQHPAITDFSQFDAAVRVALGDRPI